MMMRKGPPVILLASLLVGATDQPSDLAILFIDLPVLPEGYDVEANEVVRDLVIQKDGALLWDGEAFERSQLAARLSTLPCPTAEPQQNERLFDDPPAPPDVSAYGRLLTLQLSAEAGAKFGEVRPTLNAIKKSGICTFKFADLQAFGNFKTGSKANIPQSDFDREILGSEPGAFSVHVTTVDPYNREPTDPKFAGSFANGECRVFMNGNPVDGENLAKRSSEYMETAIENLGGVEKLVSESFDADLLPEPIIFATSNTPWRCVGGVVHNLQLGGFALVAFAPLPPEN